jgi:Ca2+-binding EF-hand superfamily protein
MDYYKELFNIIDTNNDGFINYKDILKCNPYKTTSHLIDYKEFIEKKKYQQINLYEFIEMYNFCRLTKKEIKEIFNILKKKNT